MTPEDAATLQAMIEGVDNEAKTHERTWGLDRLPSLVDDGLRARFYRQQAKWSAAIDDAYETQTCPLTHIQLETISADVWEMRLSDGSKAALVRSVAEAGHLLTTGRDDGRYVAVWTLDEIVNVIAVNVERAILKAKVVSASLPKVDRSWVREGDAIPFGGDEVVGEGVVGDEAIDRVLADFE
jgi:hypothetical protein